VLCAVVLGAGLLGTQLVAQLRSKSPYARIIVVDPKQYWETNIGAPRAMVVPEFESKISVPHSTWLPGAQPYPAPNATHGTTELLVGRATDVDPAQRVVTVERLAASVQSPPNAAPFPVEQIKYDYLVLALGSRYDLFKATQVSCVPCSVVETCVGSTQLSGWWVACDIR
jgi:NADH dehydrogenase FAD-containing subunit